MFRSPGSSPTGRGATALPRAAPPGAVRFRLLLVTLNPVNVVEIRLPLAVERDGGKAVDVRLDESEGLLARRERAEADAIGVVGVPEAAGAELGCAREDIAAVIDRDAAGRRAMRAVLGAGHHAAPRASGTRMKPSGMLLACKSLLARRDLGVGLTGRCGRTKPGALWFSLVTRCALPTAVGGARRISVMPSRSPPRLTLRQNGQ
jgi:hypothetical protein